MATILHPAGVRGLRRKWPYLVAATVLVLGAQWYLASRVAIGAPQATAAGVARTRVDASATGLVYSSTWRQPWCTVSERAVFDDKRAHTVPDWTITSLGPGRATTNISLGPCLIVQPNAAEAKRNSIGLRIGGPASDDHAMVLGCFDGREAPIVTAWSTATWQSELSVGWPFKWLRYRFAADAADWPTRDSLKPVGGVRIQPLLAKELSEDHESGARSVSFGLRPYPNHGMLTTGVHWGALCAELLLIVTLLTSGAYAAWWVWSWRARFRSKHGLCVNCGYDVKGSINTCPECGNRGQVHLRFGEMRT